MLSAQLATAAICMLVAYLVMSGQVKLRITNRKRMSWRSLFGKDRGSGRH